MPTLEMMGGFSSCALRTVEGQPARGGGREKKTNRVFPQQERTRILERNVRHVPQRIAIAPLDLPALLVLALLGRAVLGEGDGDVGGELERWSMERAKVGLGESSLVLW